MIRLIRTAVIILGMCGLISCASGESPSEAATAPPVQIILKLRNGADVSDPEMLARLTQAAGTEVRYVRPMSSGAHVLALPAISSAESAEQAVKAIGALQEVEYSQIDRRKKPYQ